MQKIIKEIKFDNLHIPIHIYREMRMDVRISILKDKVTLRLPLFMTNKQIKKNISWAKSWLERRFEENPEIKKRFEIKTYKSEDTLLINNKSFSLKINEEKRNNFSGKIENDTIYIYVPENSEAHQRQKAIKTLQSRLIAQYFLPEISNRIHLLNQKHFKFDINTIRLKYNKSNWGSRSAKNNINISTRLLFAPQDVQDYVFIHELAHFSEMNHSPAFWNIVKKIIPDYKEKEKWLKKNGHLCDF